MDEERRPEPKIPIPIIIGGFFLFGIFDVATFFFPVVGVALNAVAATIYVVITMVGIGGTAIVISQLAALLGEALPIVQALPLFTANWLFVLIVDRYFHLLPKRLQESILKAAAVAAAAKGGAKGGAKTAAAGEKTAASGVAQAEGAVASEAEVAAEAGGAAQAAEGAAGESAEGAAQSRRERARERKRSIVSQAGGEPEPEEEGPDEELSEEEMADLSPEERQLEEILSGNYVAGMIRTTMSPEDIIASIARSPAEAADLRHRLALRERRRRASRAAVPKAPPATAEGYNESNAGRNIDLRN